MIQPGRFSGKFRIHENTLVWAIDDTAAPAWRSFAISRRTARSVFVQTIDGEIRIDRIPLEMHGWSRAHGVTYYLRRHALPNDEGEDIAA